MVIYEVNVDVNKEVFADYYPWLLEHIREMLAIIGFKKAEVGLIEQPADDGKKRLRVSYFIDTYENLQNYFRHDALRMRAGSLEKFGDQFTIHRRVITEPVVLEA